MGNMMKLAERMELLRVLNGYACTLSNDCDIKCSECKHMIRREVTKADVINAIEIVKADCEE